MGDFDVSTIDPGVLFHVFICWNERYIAFTDKILNDDFFISDRSMPLNKITNFKRWPVSRLIVTILAPESGSLGSFQGSYVLVSPREPSFFRMLSMNNPLYQRLVLKKLIKTSLYLFFFFFTKYNFLPI